MVWGRNVPDSLAVVDVSSQKWGKDKSEQAYQWTLKDEPIPNVSETMHMGIMRSAATEQSATRENVQKARRTLYILMSSGLHGENGLDPETAVHLKQTYVIPVLVYGMEVVLPKQKYVDMLEKFNKKFLKLILSVAVLILQCTCSVVLYQSRRLYISAYWHSSGIYVSYLKHRLNINFQSSSLA